jgi:hypothetical protein
MGPTRARLVRRLNRLARQPSVELQNLERHWPAVKRAVQRKRIALSRAIPKDDPIRLQVDLLGPINCASNEVLHTQALAYAMDPHSSHQLAKHVLISILEFLRNMHPRSGAARVLRTARKAGARISVKPEYRYVVEGFRDKAVARTDIWIEIQVAKRSALVVVENKINAAESDGQLSWYERKAEAWCKARGHDRFLLVFLSKKGNDASTSANNRWVAMSYLQLAAALRKVWRKARSAPGAQWLALYIASITRGVLNIDLERHGGVTLLDIQTYLSGGNR